MFDLFNSLAGIHVSKLKGLYRCGIVHNNERELRRANMHEGFAISWILSGKGSFTTNDKVYELGSGNVCIRYPNLQYTLELFGGMTHRRCYLLLPKSFYDILISFAPSTTSLPPVLHIPYDLELVKEFYKLSQLLNNTSDIELYKIFPNIYTLVLKLLNINISDNDSNVALTKAKKLLGDVDYFDYSLSEIASKCNIAYNTFRTHFTNTYNISPGQYRINVKIDKAIYYLTLGKSVGETSMLLRYVDIYTFSKQFKKQVGVSPQQFIKNNLF